ncbi:MAG: hypothetical protein DRJ28_05370 [Actinobacteria bacterium]|nr:MAG: hypothetical protein DRJ28_05370 [Actinomycetota bacterium]
MVTGTLSLMPEFRHHTIVVDGVTIEITEAGPSRCPDTVVIVGASDDMAISLLVRLGRFTRVVSIQKWSPVILDALDLSNVHIVVASDTDNVDDVVDLLQRTVAID